MWIWCRSRLCTSAGRKMLSDCALADEGRAVGGVLDQPALVDLEGGLEHRLLVVVEEVEMLHRALADGDRGPGVLVVLALLRPAASRGTGCAPRTSPTASCGCRRWPPIGSMPGEAPPQMIEIEAVGAIASLLEKRSSMPKSAASGQAPRSSASALRGLVALAADVLEHLLVPHLGHHRFERDVVRPAGRSGSP